MRTPSVDERSASGEGEERLVDCVKDALMTHMNVFGPIPGVSVILVENTRGRPGGHSEFLFRGTSGLKAVSSVEEFERSLLVDHVVRAGGGPHVRVRISVRRSGMDGPWDCYFWVPGADAADAALRLLAISVMGS